MERVRQLKLNNLISRFDPSPNRGQRRSTDLMLDVTSHALKEDSSSKSAALSVTILGQVAGLVGRGECGECLREDQPRVGCHVSVGTHTRLLAFSGPYRAADGACMGCGVEDCIGAIISGPLSR